MVQSFHFGLRNIRVMKTFLWWFSAKLTKFTHFWSKNILGLFAPQVFSNFFFWFGIFPLSGGFCILFKRVPNDSDDPKFFPKNFLQHVQKIFFRDFGRFWVIFSKIDEIHSFLVEKYFGTFCAPSFFEFFFLIWHFSSFGRLLYTI